MIRCLVLAAVVACGGSSAKTDYPSLDPDPPQTPPTTPLAPLPDPAEFAAPPSNPTGEPVVITWVPPAVGDRRTRDASHTALYYSEWDTDSRRQRTVNHFRIVEHVTQVEGSLVTALEISVQDGQETILLDGEHIPRVLVSGAYTVKAAPDRGSVEVERADSAFRIGDREREELQGLYESEVGRVSSLVLLIKDHAPLRVGETVELTAEEKSMLAGGEPLAVPMHLALLSVEGGVGTFQISFFGDLRTGEGAEEKLDQRGVKTTAAFEVATGRVRTMRSIGAHAESSSTMKSRTRSEDVQTLIY